jgi:membrane protein YdbS with pleckstrin-like domain
MASNPPITTAGPETPIGEWHATTASPKFWLYTIITLSLYYFLVHRYSRINLTTRRVTQHRGSILTSNDTTMSVTNVTDITVNQSVLGRLFNYGDIVIQSAGSGASEIAFVGLHDPVRLREAIYDLKDGTLDESVGA